MLENITWGAELEIADWNVKEYGNSMMEATGAKVDRRESTIMNSSGVSNDPTLTTCIFGGEINTKVTSTIDEQVDHILRIFESIGAYSLNHSCALHIHLGIPGLNTNLERVRKYATWIYKNQRAFYNEVVAPKSVWTSEQLKGDDLKAFKRKLKGLKNSRWTEIPLFIIENLNAETQSDFKGIRNCFFRKSKKTGRILPWTNTRAMINLPKIFKETETIEFRCFNVTDKEEELRQCFNLCLKVIACIEAGGTFDDIEFNPSKIPGSSEFHIKEYLLFEQIYNSNYELHYRIIDKNDKNTPLTRGSLLKELLDKGEIKLEDLGVPISNLDLPVVIDWSR